MSKIYLSTTNIQEAHEPNSARLRHLERLKAPTFTDHLLAMPTDDGTFDRLEGALREADP